MLQCVFDLQVISLESCKFNYSVIDWVQCESAIACVIREHVAISPQNEAIMIRNNT